jgi:ABC-type nitrate/sulfonate/bicarbonate transport system substrate-binding protein
MRCKKWLGKIVLMFALVNAAFEPSLRAQEKLVPVNVSIGSLVVGLAPYVIAKQNGYFRQEGILPQFILMQSSVASKAIITKDIEFNTLGSPTINSAIVGLAVRGIFANGNRTNMYLVGSKEIGSLEDLKGKRIGVGGFGDLGQVGTIRFLRSHRIDPKEVTFIVVGGGQSAGRLGAVISGAVAATPLSPPYDYMGKKAGLKVLGYFGDIFPSYYASLGVHLCQPRCPPRYIPEQAPAGKRFCQSKLEGPQVDARA